MKLEHNTRETEEHSVIKMEKQVTQPKSGKELSELTQKKLKLVTSNGSRERSERDPTINNSNQSSAATEVTIDVIPGYLSAKQYNNVNLA